MHVFEADVEATDLVEVGRAVGDAEPLEVLDHVDQWLPQRVALSGKEEVDDAERILGRRVRPSGGCRPRWDLERTAIVAGHDLGDCKPAGAEQCENRDYPAHDLSLAALADVSDRHHGDDRWRERWSAARGRADRRAHGWGRYRPRGVEPDAAAITGALATGVHRNALSPS